MLHTGKKGMVLRMRRKRKRVKRRGTMRRNESKAAEVSVPRLGVFGKEKALAR